MVWLSWTFCQGLLSIFVIVEFVFSYLYILYCFIPISNFYFQVQKSRHGFCEHSQCQGSWHGVFKNTPMAMDHGPIAKYELHCIEGTLNDG
jgi:hypothetical protein